MYAVRGAMSGALSLMEGQQWLKESSPRESSPSRSSSGWFGLLEGWTDQDDLDDLPDPDDKAGQELSLHDLGSCEPCVLSSSVRGCLKGEACPYCHESHADKMSAHRPRKQTRDKFKQSVKELLAAHKGDVEEIHEKLQDEARKSPYVRKLLQGYLDGADSDFLFFTPPGLSPPPAAQAALASPAAARAAPPGLVAQPALAAPAPLATVPEGPRQLGHAGVQSPVPFGHFSRWCLAG
ncbi:unnamed protein product [Effrenium voratum]|nr:unnamed protein product [Effrenium voratum]